jgi:hypothetical protein
VLLGLAYEMGGAGLKKQPPMALSWFLKAADQGITWAQVWAADFYLSGTDGIERDVNKALILYKSAAEHGDAKAPFFIGQIYFYGDGVAADQQEAAAWYRRARASDVPVVESMIALTATPCASAFCVGFRQVVAAIMTESGNRFIDGWDEAKHEWDSTITLPQSERCGLTSADRTNAGEVQNYFCDSAQVADEARGIAMAKQLADAVQSALPGGYSRRERTDMRPGPSTFFEMENFPSYPRHLQRDARIGAESCHPPRGSLKPRHFQCEPRSPRKHKREPGTRSRRRRMKNPSVSVRVPSAPHCRRRSR